jgi:hypothetical protein
VISSSVQYQKQLCIIVQPLRMHIYACYCMLRIVIEIINMCRMAPGRPATSPINNPKISSSHLYLSSVSSSTCTHLVERRPCLVELVIGHNTSSTRSIFTQRRFTCRRAERLVSVNRRSTRCSLICRCKFTYRSETL